VTRIVFAIPGDLSRRTGGYAYDRRVLAELPRCGVEAAHCALPGGFPDPSAAETEQSVAAINRAARGGGVALIDGLAYGALTEDAVRAICAPVVALCHHPLCQETGLGPARADALRRNERRALELAAHVVVTSDHTKARLVKEFCLPRERISVAPPGTDPAPRARGSGGAPALLAIGSIISRKGYDVLIDALAGLADLDWRLRIVGDAAASPQRALELNRLMETTGLAGRIELRGELATEQLDLLFDTRDMFVSSSFYEGYGMALAEALARGLPIAMTKAGAATETVPDAAALKVPVGDALGLGAALRRLVEDGSLRARLAEESWRAGQALPRWEDAARRIADAARNISEASR